MDFELSEDQQAFHRTAREFAANELAPHAARWDAEKYFPRETLVQAIRLRLRGDTPFGYYISWTRTEHEEFSEAKLANSSRLKLFDAAGIHFKQVEQVLSALNADAISALHLKVEPGTALLSLERGERSCPLGDSL